MSTQKRPSPDRLTITPAQCRAARALLGWTQEELAERSGVTLRTIQNFELGQTVPFGKTMAALLDSLHAVGIAFTNTPDRIGLSMPAQPPETGSDTPPHRPRRSD